MNTPDQGRTPLPGRPHRRATAAPTLALLALLAGCGTAPPQPAGTAQQQDVSYLCEGGARLDVSYLNPPAGESFASMRYQGHIAVLQSRPAASGVRYVDQDEQQGLRWYTKGDEGFLAIQPADHTAAERTLLSGCRAQRQP
ncbi:MliC family protein [Hydrogenophaga sp. NFH-34]|uniref:MliC family protein n=1 Tax=Hydrogenophaga sp. NFH-34 TaxID=2744446 RepID=UPI001F2B6362|nr:MliC family protein [Hydrogenophaga sp. NFH-34]